MTLNFKSVKIAFINVYKIGHTPLHVAAAVDGESTSVLLASGANPNATDRDGRTPLHCSVSRGKKRV